MLIARQCTGGETSCDWAATGGAKDSSAIEVEFDCGQGASPKLCPNGISRTEYKAD